MTTRSELFEQMVHRTHELLDGADAVVTWNDRVPDPDTMGRGRQVDITVRRGSMVTLVECRDRGAKQDVTWIEELIGRRLSHKADAVIAVSSSGFTSTAINKAKAFGIVARDLRSLTDREIELWGQATSIVLYHLQFSDVSIALELATAPVVPLPHSEVRAALCAPATVRGLFNAAAAVLEPELNLASDFHNKVVRFGCRLVPPDLSVAGHCVLEVQIEGKATLATIEAVAPAVRSYGVAQQGAPPDAMIETFGLGETAVVHADDRVAIVVDLTGVDMPPMSLFRYVRFVSEQDTDCESFELLGVDKMIRLDDRVSVSIVARGA